jgi:hypothetical protein|tara:strand:+ start:897 stop:1229 length:333 start_codon:yes stop_codon:yes gene_type:complete
MKKLLLILFCLPLIYSCGTGYYNTSMSVTNQCYLGMSIQEFKQIKWTKKRALLEVMELGYTVYKIHDWSPYIQGKINNTNFYYFDSGGKLVKIDGGQFKQDRYQIEILNN